MIFRLSLIFLALITEQASALPIDNSVTQDTINKTICVPNWTDTVRPSVSYTNRVKLSLMKAAGLPATTARQDNLQLQPVKESWVKDQVEKCMARAVCQGLINLTSAREALWINWRNASCPLRK
jgi:hypothetical protein